MTASLIQSPDRVVLRHISWQTYQSLIQDFEAEPAIRLTYDRGTYEVCDRSVALPLLQAKEIARFLGLRFSRDGLQTTVSENALVRQFRQWIRQTA